VSWVLYRGSQDHRDASIINIVGKKIKIIKFRNNLELNIYEKL